MSDTARKAGIRLAGDTGPNRASDEWQADLDAGRLTAATGPGTTPEIAANRARTEAAILRHAASQERRR